MSLAERLGAVEFALTPRRLVRDDPDKAHESLCVEARKP